MLSSTYRRIACRKQHKFPALVCACSSTAHQSTWRGVAEHAEVAELSNCRMEFRSGRLARFTGGSVVLTLNDNAILGTVVSKYSEPKDASPLLSGLNLSVDFRQSAAAIGRIPMNYFRRELSQSDQDIITSRIIDRSLRPAFLPNYPGQTQIVCKTLALDDTGDSVVLGVNAASAALAVSSVPMRCSVAAARVGIVDDRIVVNPPRELLKRSSMNMVLSGTDDERVIMIEMDGCEIDMELFLKCVERGFTEVNLVNAAIGRLAKAVAQQKYKYFGGSLDEQVLESLKTVQPMVQAIFKNYEYGKTSRDRSLSEVKDMWMKQLPSDIPKEGLSAYFSEFSRRMLRETTFANGLRCDGRRFDEFRHIKIEVDVFKKLHGSALFQRGQSQVFSTVTFDSPSAAFHPDAIAQLLGAQRRKTFMLHYEFPQFAINEFGSDHGGQNRREVGHGMLAEKALKHVVPPEYPFAIRLACQVLESNGSTSMASACAGSLALYDAGVQLSNPVAGVAIGLLTKEGKSDSDEPEDYALLTDLLGIEDFFGDMDFKMAGTLRGFTAMQLDMKIRGLSRLQLRESLQRGRQGIDYVLGLMNAAIASPRTEFKPSVPIMEALQLPMFKRGILFRSSAYNAKLIESETGVKITAEDDKNLSLMAPNMQRLEEAKQMIARMLQEEGDESYLFGAIYKAKVVEIQEMGIRVSLKEGTRPMFIRNIDLSMHRKHASALQITVGDEINVQYFGRDQNTGFHRLSCRTLQLIDPPDQNLLKKP